MELELATAIEESGSRSSARTRSTRGKEPFAKGTGDAPQTLMFTSAAGSRPTHRRMHSAEEDEAEQSALEDSGNHSPARTLFYDWGEITQLLMWSREAGQQMRVHINAKTIGNLLPNPFLFVVLRLRGKRGNAKRWKCGTNPRRRHSSMS